MNKYNYYDEQDAQEWSHKVIRMYYIYIHDDDMDWSKVEGNTLELDGKLYRIVGFDRKTFFWILKEE